MCCCRRSMNMLLAAMPTRTVMSMNMNMNTSIITGMITRTSMSMIRNMSIIMNTVICMTS